MRQLETIQVGSLMTKGHFYLLVDDESFGCRGDCAGSCEGDCSNSCEGDCAWGCSDGCQGVDY